jgi:hypothetical protein
MIKNVEQYIKPEIADKLLSVWSLALASSAHLMHRRLEAIERWVNQVQEAVIGENHVSVLLPVHHLLVQIRQLLQSDATTLI